LSPPSNINFKVEDLNLIFILNHSPKFLVEMIKVGCCGYPTSQKRYYEVFRLVELNKTFYVYPRISTVKGWREKAPENFEFTVKAHQDISHKFKLKPEESCLEAFERMKEICKILKAKILLVQTPGSLRPDKLQDAQEFFSKIDREELTVVWETRGSAWDEQIVRKKLAAVLKKLDVPHVTDPLRTLPAYTSDTVYFRLHGLGERMYYYQYTDEELKKLHSTVKQLADDGKKVYVLFNNLSMFEDAYRFNRYLETGKLPRVTGATGLESVRLVIEKTRYPAQKSVLIKRLGWKLVELEDGKQIRLGEILNKIPSKSYGDVEEVLKEVRPLL